MAESNELHERREEHGAPEAEPKRHPQVEYERLEVSLVGVLVVLLGLLFLFAAVGGAAWWYMQAHARGVDRPAEAAEYSAPAEPLPPEPRLEPLNAVEGRVSSDIYLRHAVMERILHSYGRLDEEGFVHIPIEKAMELAAERLPERQSAGKEKCIYGLLDGGEPNSGRIYLEAPPWFYEPE